MNLILLGAPGAGKGTQGELIAQKLGIPTISTGNMLREAVANGTELGKKVKHIMETGALVPDELILDLVQERVAQPDCKNGFILDGVPRTLPQAEALDARGVKIEHVVSLEIDDQVIMDRMSGRRVCKACGATYHTKYKPSPNGENCKCGEPLSIRADDDAEVVKSRLEIYHAQTEPLKEFYNNKGLLKIVVGQEKLEDTTALTNAALEG